MGRFSLPQRIAAAPRLRALALMWQASPALSGLAVAFVIAEGVLPVLVLVAMGRVTGDIPAAVLGGLSSPAGHTLVTALALAGGIYALSLMRGPLEDALTAAVTARVDARMRTSLVRAACGPVGIEPLEDQAVQDQLASAQGQLLNADPAGASMMVVSLAGDRLTGILACVVLATWHWWVGLGLLAIWFAVRRPLATLIRARTTRARSAGPVLRRSWYMLGLAWRPYAGKEMRVFGLADWTAQRHRDQWLEAMEPSWREVAAAQHAGVAGRRGGARRLRRDRVAARHLRRAPARQPAHAGHAPADAAGEPLRRLDQLRRRPARARARLAARPRRCCCGD